VSGRRFAGLFVAWLLAVMLPSALTAGEARAETGVDGNPSTNGRPYPGDPETESELVAAEDDRLVEVRTVGSLNGGLDVPISAPYRLATGSAYTLVLTQRREHYTIDDLLSLAPQTFLRRPDGSYLLLENLVIESGATLDLVGPEGLRLLLASDSKGFVSIVNYGGRLNISGARGAPAVISSFDRRTEGADKVTDDGRAYVRSIGGQISVANAEIAYLGFWSGRTGGLSLTGTDRPDSGALDDMGRSLDIFDLAKQRAAERDRLESLGQDPTVPEGTSDHGQVLPAGKLPVPLVDMQSPEYSFVSASITNTRVIGNAFGVFVSGANGLDVRDSTFERSLVGGIVLHRYVVNAVLEGTSANNNAQDGIVLARATTGIVLSEVEANGNGRNGVTMSGLPLANGPSATGSSLGSYGNNSLANSHANENGRYGIEVLGGVNIGVFSNEVRGNDMGVVVRDGTARVDVVGNSVVASQTQGIAVRDSVRGATVTGNMVKGGTTSVYVRDSVAYVENNTLSDAEQHAISLVGDVQGTSLTGNTISGRGPSAVDAQRAQGADRKAWDNDTSRWQDTTPFLVTLKRFLQPLTAVWSVLALLLLFTAVHGARARRQKRHPYADKMPITDGRPHQLAPDGAPGGAGAGFG
jgi:hypothetical protein